METTTMSITVPKSMYRRVSHAAKDQDRSISAFVRVILDKHLEKENPPKRKIIKRRR
jgi:predicted DNA-binding protein